MLKIYMEILGGGHKQSVSKILLYYVIKSNVEIRIGVVGGGGHVSVKIWYESEKYLLLFGGG